MHISLFFLQTVYPYIQLFELQVCSLKSVSQSKLLNQSKQLPRPPLWCHNRRHLQQHSFSERKRLKQECTAMFKTLFNTFIKQNYLPRLYKNNLKPRNYGKTNVPINIEYSICSSLKKRNKVSIINELFTQSNHPKAQN